MVDEVNDVRIIGVITIIPLLVIAISSMAWEARVSALLDSHVYSDIVNATDLIVSSNEQHLIW